jgi:hypothetical protein
MPKVRSVERVHGLVHAQALDIRPVQHARADERHVFGIGQRHELDELRVAQRLDLLDQLGQRVADPGITIDQPSTQRRR